MERLVRFVGLKRVGSHPSERSVRRMDREALIPIVDENDCVIGTALRSDMRAANLLHRCTAVLVLDRTGERLLVHRRSVSKSFWAGWWDLVAGGVVGVGEDLDDAATRELLEELGVEAELHKLGSARYRNDEVDVFMHVWVAHHDGPFTFADGEVDRAEWVTPVELQARLSNPGVNWCSDSVGVALPLLRDAFPVWQPQEHDL
jgi:isopentenyldiphosphate isomerase